MQRNERLRQQRIQHNWRLNDIADQLGTTTTTLSRWERGIQQPSVYYRTKLCALFGLSAYDLGLAEVSTSENNAQEAKPQSSPLTRERALWTVPYARNPHFTGRDELLDQLLQQFAPTDQGQPTTIRKAALTQSKVIKGLGGMGKTQIAVEYAYRAREQGRYTHTLWIAAASEEAILASFSALAELLPGLPTLNETDQRKLVATCIHWLERCEQPWLLLFDNADDLSLVQAYLPLQGNGCVLLTTRASAVGSLASFLEVDSMSLMEGTQFLLRRAGRLDHASLEEIDEAGNIAVALTLFPLALDQAGAYIEETGCSLHDYLQLYEKHRYALLARRGKQAMGYPEPVSATWSLSFERLEQVNPAAAELLRLCAFLAPDHIPEELLIQGAPYWPPLLQQAISNPLTFNQMLEDLLRFSLVKRLAEDHLLSLHRLVQVVQREHLEPQEQRMWAERLIRAVHTVFPSNPTSSVETWPQCQRYLEQAQVCDTLIQHYQIQLPEATELLNRTGTYLRECALYTLAEPLYQRALSIREQHLGPEHPDTAETLNDLALLYWKQGKYTQAEPLYQRALSIREQHLGPEHPNTAETLNDLTILYYEQGKYTQAELLFQQALNIREQHLGAEHPDTAETLNNMAALYYQQGRYEEAKRLFQRALHIREQQLGAEHPEMSSSLNNLANIYRNQGKYEQAEPLYRRALHIREQQLGAEHPDVAWPLQGLANLYYLQGRYEEAERLFQQVLRMWEQHLGSEHPDVAYPLHGLALLYSKQRKDTEAESLFLQALHTRKQQVGSEHPGMAAILHDFADFRQAQGSLSEAASMYQRALTIREHVLGAEHPLTNKTRARLYAECIEAK